MVSILPRFGAGLSILLLLAAALPFLQGGNRPAAWFVTGMAAGAVAAAVALDLLHRGGRLHLGLGQAPWLSPLALAPAVAAFALVLAGAAAPGLFGTVDPDQAAIAALRLGGPVLAGALAFHLLRLRNGRRDFGLALLAGMLLQAVYALAVLRNPDLRLFDAVAYEGMLTGGFVNRNSAAFFFGLAACLALAALLTAGDRGAPPAEVLQARALLAVVLLVLLLCVGLTRSRMGTAATGVGLGVVAALHLLSTGRGASGRAAALATLAALPVAATLFVVFAVGRFEAMTVDVAARLALQLESLDAALSAPWLGVGPGGFEMAFRETVGRLSDPGLRWEDAHNTYLENWTEMGFLLGSLPIAALSGIFLLSLRQIRQGGDRFLPLALCGVIAAGALHSAVDFPLEMQGILLPVCLLAGASLSGFGLRRAPA